MPSDHRSGCVPRPMSVRYPPHDPTTQGMRRGRRARARQLVPDVAVGVHARADDRAGLRAKLLESSCREVVAVELGPTAVFVSDKERLRIRIPVGECLARQIELDIVDRGGGHIEDQRLAPAAAVVEREKPLIAWNERPRDWLEAEPWSVPELRDGAAIQVEN